MSSQGTQSLNQGCYFAIKHSDTCNQLKEGTLLITAAIATIVLIGGILGVLALNGVNLGALNSITTIVGEKYIYIGLATGTGLLLIDTVLIAALTRSYYNKQYTLKEVNNFGLSEWLDDHDILSMLEPGQYWKFPEEVEKPIAAVAGHPGRPAIWGYVVRDLKGNPGVYAFKTEEDALAHRSKLGYENGELFFAEWNDPIQFPAAWVVQNFDLHALTFPSLKAGEFAVCNLIQKIQDKDMHVFALKIQDNDSQPRYLFFKAEDAREQYIGQNLANYIDLTGLDDAIKGIIKQYRLASMLQTPGRDCWIEEVELNGTLYYLVVGLTDQGIQYKCFKSEETRAYFIGEIWKPVNDRFAYRGQFKEEWVRAHIEPETLFRATQVAGRLANNQFECSTIQTYDGTDIYCVALKNQDEATIHYFSTEQALRRFILHIERSQLTERIQNELLLDYAFTNINDCWGVGQVRLGERRINILYTTTAEGIQVSYPKDLVAAKNGLNDVQAQIEATGEYPTQLGIFLNREGVAVSQKNMKMQNKRLQSNECVSWAWNPAVQSTENSTHKNLFVLQIKTHVGSYLRYFKTANAREEVQKGFTHAYPVCNKS